MNKYITSVINGVEVIETQIVDTYDSEILHIVKARDAEFTALGYSKERIDYYNSLIEDVNRKYNK